jgi:hypothetical protein
MTQHVLISKLKYFKILVIFDKILKYFNLLINTWYVIDCNKLLYYYNTAG